MTRIIISLLISFILTAAMGKVVIPWLHRLKAGQSIKKDGPTWHMSKQGTPTMGGIMFIVAIAIAVVICSFADMRRGDFGALYVYGFALVFGVIGFIDDFMKVKYHKNEGLTAIQKFLLQLAAAILLIVILRNAGYLSTNLYIPFFNVYWKLPLVVYLVLAAFIIVGCVNSVNLTDGVDGLAAGVTIPVALFFTVAAVLMKYTELGVLAAALLGGLAAFLIYNFHPAKVFMGDTGSLFLGGLVCGLAFALDIPLILILVGIVYICETLSDIIQVAYFKATHGKRIFKMAPLHHHFEMCGWSEYKLFFVFSGITLAACALAVIGILGRL